jgi:selenocysteine lyase/cysteine desulfurase
VLSLGFEKYMSDDAGTILDGEYDIAVRTGYHCAPLVHYGGTVRISMGQFTTKEDVDELVAAVRDMR